MAKKSSKPSVAHPSDPIEEDIGETMEDTDEVTGSAEKYFEKAKPVPYEEKKMSTIKESNEDEVENNNNNKTNSQFTDVRPRTAQTMGVNPRFSNTFFFDKQDDDTD